jgi:hypothetical protein
MFSKKEFEMSKMNELSMLIQARLKRGEEPVGIAYALDIPISWIFEELELLQENHSPYATCNS